ncbi:hypothetical protein CF086_17470 [Clostridium botulinum]|uniref:DHH family phosphoesterase n=1 Tax=Clostridium botulinum TaxID=1491 RepID=UPI000774B02D|nr:DHH family phosphoesterase [Clostridium botulinum]MBN3352088.1 hypothetical protein [Clostridium botulinum]
MKWKVINNNKYEEVRNNLLQILLKNRGVTDIQALLNVNKNNTHHWSKMNNMKKGIDCFLTHANKKNHIHIIQDSDADGMTSAIYFYNYIYNNFKIKCTYHVHKGKQHGIILKEFKELEYLDDIDLIISPDGGSFDYEEQKKLIDMGKDIIVLDHHLLEENTEFKENNSIVINPQLDNYPNKTLSGVGVVHKFCEALDELCKFNDSQNYLDLVALGMVADNMDLRDLETRYYVLEGIKQMRQDKERRDNNLKITGNSFIQEIIKSKEDKKLKHINIDSIGWEIAPLLNGMARFGKQEEKIDTFRALIEEKEDRWYQPRRKKKTDLKPDKVLKTLQEEMVRICTNAKSRQDRAKAKGIEKLEIKIHEKQLDKNKILIIDGTNELVDSTLTGLVANGLASKYKKPCVLLRKKSDNVYGGSMRDYDMSPIENFNKFLVDTNKFEWVKGHDGAAGFSIKKEKLFEINNTIEEMLKNTVMEDTHLVDYEIPVGRLNKEQIMEIGSYQDIWGNTLKKPKFAITDINIETKNIELLGERKNVLRFKKYDITFIKFFANEEMLNKMKMKNKKGFGKAPKTVKLDVVCYASTNEYNDVKYPQLEILDFYVRKADEVIF